MSVLRRVKESQVLSGSILADFASYATLDQGNKVKGGLPCLQFGGGAYVCKSQNPTEGR